MYQTPTRSLREQYPPEATIVPDMFDDRAWFAVVAQPGRQAQARDELMRQDYGAFLPMCRRQVTHARKTETVERPLFDRYLFVGVDLDGGQPFTPINSTRGVAFVVRGGTGAPSRIPVSALRKIKERCDADGGSVDLVPASRVLRWAEGTELRVTDGPFTGLLAVFSGAHGDRAAKVLVDVFGRPTVATIPIVSLDRAAF